jgi:hypothetical protein
MSHASTRVCVCVWAVARRGCRRGRCRRGKRRCVPCARRALTARKVTKVTPRHPPKRVFGGGDRCRPRRDRRSGRMAGEAMRRGGVGFAGRAVAGAGRWRRRVWMVARAEGHGRLRFFESLRITLLVICRTAEIAVLRNFDAASIAGGSGAPSREKGKAGWPLSPNCERSGKALSRFRGRGLGEGLLLQARKEQDPHLPTAVRRAPSSPAKAGEG